MNEAATLDLEAETTAMPETKPKQIVTHDHAVMSAGDMTPMLMLDRAIQSNASMETLEKLMALQERWEGNQARKAFNQAMAAARAEISPIIKNRKVDFTSSKGRTNYAYEDLGEIARSVDPILAKYGLSYRFRVSSALNEPVSVTCIVSHRDGHSEENTLVAGRDTTGNKNDIQAIGSTITFLERYTLKSALGLAATVDDDGKAANAGGAISADQLAELEKFIDDNDAEPSKILAHAEVSQLADIRAKDFPALMTSLRGWAAQQKAAAK